MREIEIKLRVKNLEDLEKKLISAGLNISKEVSQHDIVYASKIDDKNFDYNNAGEGHIALRIRQENNTAKFTLKQQKSNEMDNLEYETEINNPEAMKNILEKLGWKSDVEVKKTRKKGKMGDYEICLDRVEGLREFIEIEKITQDDANPDEVRKELFEAIKPFGLTEVDEETKGYDTLIYNLNNKK